VPAVVEAADWFPEINHGVLSNPKFNLIRGDGRNYALITEKEYDIVSVDATSPKMAGNGSLYSLEFYKSVTERLSGEGLVVQWIPFHLLSDREVRMITKTFMTAFPHTTLWFSPLRQHVILVGTQQRLQIDYASLSGKLATPDVQQDLSVLNITDPFDVLSMFVMGEEALQHYVGDVAMNTDNHPYLEFTPALAYFVSDAYWFQTMRRMRESRESVFPYLINVGETEQQVTAVADKFHTRFEARHHSIDGDILLLMGMQEEAIEEYNRAIQIDPAEKNWMNTIWIRVGGPR
jgi:spermidine synthase